MPQRATHDFVCTLSCSNTEAAAAAFTATRFEGQVKAHSLPVMGLTSSKLAQAISGFLGAPPPNGAIPQAPMHTRSLITLRTMLRERDSRQQLKQEAEAPQKNGRASPHGAADAGSGVRSPAAHSTDAAQHGAADTSPGFAAQHEAALHKNDEDTGGALNELASDSEAQAGSREGDELVRCCCCMLAAAVRHHCHPCFACTAGATMLAHAASS